MMKRLTWILILLLGICLFVTHDITVSDDLGKYMNFGLNVYLGKGYVDIDGEPLYFRGPLFSWLIAFAFWLLGPSPWSAFWVVRVFCILNPLMLYFLGKKMVNKQVGIGAALLALSSYTICHWSYRHIDGAWPFFVLCTILLLYTGFEKKKAAYFAAAGFTLALGYLIKESSILLLPLPFFVLIWVQSYRKEREYFKYLGYYLLTFALPVLPWIFYVFMNTGDIKLAILGQGSTLASTGGVLLKYPLGLFLYLANDTNSFRFTYTLAPLMLAAAAYAGYKAIKKQTYAIMLCSALLLMSPLVSLTGLNNFRAGQLLLLHLLLYLATAALLVSGCRWVVNRLTGVLEKFRPYRSLMTGAATAAILVIVIAIQVFVATSRDRGGYAFFKRSSLFNLFSRARDGEPFHRVDAGTKGLMETAAWMSHTLEPGATLMTTWSTDTRQLYFHSGNRFTILTIPLITVLWQTIPGHPFRYYRGEFFRPHWLRPNFPPPGDLVFLSSQRGTTNRQTRRLWLLYQSHLFREIENRQVDYLVVGPVFNFLSLYFNENPSFRQTAVFDGGKIKVFKVLRPMVPVAKSTVYLSRRTSRLLKYTENRDAGIYSLITRGLMREKLGFDGAAIQQMKTAPKDRGGQFTTVILNRAYH
jgi:4-amino-4-deoxy-L-arabinose transferase-like glycosyltransferase